MGYGGGFLANDIRKAALFVSDLDGTVYLGDRPIDGAVELANALRKRGKRLLFFTNNASKTKRFYTEKLKRLGFGDCEVMTAGDVTISYLLRNYPEKSVCLVGTELLKSDMLTAGINIVNSAEADIVVSSFDTELTYEKVRTACDAIANGALYLATHPDYKCPLDNGAFLPDSGAIAAMITAATGKTPKYLGKPYKETATAIGVATGVPAESTVCIGDRLYTDIALAKNSGMISALVLSGETVQSDITEENRPDYVFGSVADIIELL